MKTNYIVYALAGLFVLYVSRNYIKGWILTTAEKRKNKLPAVNSELVYVPIKSSRTFFFAVEIDEVGDGKATLSIVKPKDLTANITGV